MSNTDTLILTGDGYGLAIAPEAEAQKAELLKHSELIAEVKDNPSADAARNQVKKLAAMRNLIEKSRKAIKEPVIKIGRDIDARAAEFAEALALQEKRISRLIAGHAAEVERQRMEAQAEARRIEAEARAAQEKAERERIEAEYARLKAEQEAEAARLKAEAEAKAADIDDIDAQLAAAEAIDRANEAKAKAAREAEEARKAEAARQAEAERLAADARQASLVASTERTAGVKFDIDFEVTDVHALYQHNAGLVDLTPRRREILARIKGMMIGDDLPTIPGLDITKKAVVSTR